MIAIASTELTMLFWVVVVVSLILILTRSFPRNAVPLVVFAIVLLAAGANTAFGYEGAGPRQPTRAEAKRWVKNWCKVKPGYKLRHAVKLMGRPTGTGPDQMEWSGFGYELYAFLDERGRVRQLDINDIGMSRRQRARLKCADTRRAR
jgi:hypothetical protein